jgi:hypothetical protein
MEPPLIEKKGQLDLPQPEEKLLRMPTFLEKYSWLKPISIIIILITTIILSIYYLLQTEDQTTNITNTPPKTTMSSPTPTTVTDPTVNWKTYVSAEGRYSIKYPANYTLSENASGSSNTTQFYSNLLPEINTNFRLTINHKPANNQTLGQLINQNKICSDIAPTKGMASIINGAKLAQLYIDTPCSSNPTTIIYTINNETFYILSIETQKKYSEIKQYTDQILATLRFFDQVELTPISCRPRPACLDSIPRCMIPETSDMCPRATPTQKQIIYCTQDAKQCPDGSWIGRTGPNCEFVCPNATPTSAAGCNKYERNCPDVLQK